MNDEYYKNNGYLKRTFSNVQFGCKELLQYLIFLPFFLPFNLNAQSDIWETRFKNGYDWLDSNRYQLVLDSCDLWLNDPKISDKYAANFLNLKGNTFQKLGKIPDAIPMFKKALTIRKEVFDDNSREVANVYQNLFNVFWDLQDYEKAEFYANENLKIRKEFPSDSEDLIDGHIYRGDALIELNRVGEAENHFQAAIDAQSKIHYWNRLTPIIQTDLANCFFKKGAIQRALDSLQQASVVLDSLGLSNSKNGGQVLHLQGKCFYEKGDFDLAKMYFLAARSYFKNPSLEKVNLLLDLVRLARMKDNSLVVFDYLSECHSEISLLPLTPLSKRLEMDILIQKADYSIMEMDFAAADYYLKNATEIAENLDNSTFYTSNIFIKKGNRYLAEKLFFKATNFYQKALKIAEENGTINQQYSVYTRLGELKSIQNNHAKAIEYFEKALFVLGNPDDLLFPFETIQINGLLAKTYKKEYNWESVLKYASNAIDALETLRGDFRNEDSEINLQKTFSELYNWAIEAHFALKSANFAQKSFELAERYRITLFQKLAHKAASYSSNNNEFLERRNYLRKQLVQSKRARFEAIGQGKALTFRNDEIERLDDLILSFTEELLILEKEFSKNESSDNFAQNQKIDVKEIQKTLRPEQTFIEYQWAESHVFVFLIKRDVFSMEKIPISNNFQNEVIRFFEICRQNPGEINENPIDETELPIHGYYLFRKLIEPFIVELDTEIIIAPDAWLWYLPFEALLTKPAEDKQSYWTFPYWARTATISYAHSALLFNKLNSEKRPSNSKPLLGVAPIFEQDSRGLDSLSFNEKEIELAHSILGGNTFKNKEARESTFLEKANDYRILLLATHGVLDDSNASWSYIAFSEKEEDNDYANLYAWEIRDLRLSTELVVLSACETAFGEFFPGEGLISLTRAFQLSGSGGVVSSLWNVDDEQAPKLMEEFLNNLANEKTKSQSLALAKQNYLENAQSLKTHPFYWSGFMFIGDDRPMENLKPVWHFWSIGMAFLILLGLFIWRRKNLSL